MKVLHKIMPLGFHLMELPQTFGLQLQDPHALTIHPINFWFNAKCTYIIYES
jgi:hypothetical protein